MKKEKRGRFKPVWEFRCPHCEWPHDYEPFGCDEVEETCNWKCDFCQKRFLVFIPGADKFKEIK